MRVLLIEDEQKVAEAVREGLEAEGFRVLRELGVSTEQRGETCSRSSPLGVLTEETHHQRDKGVEFVRPARGRPVEV